MPELKLEKKVSMGDKIPCDYCNDFVKFEDYAEHIGPCEIRWKKKK